MLAKSSIVIICVYNIRPVKARAYNILSDSERFLLGLLAQTPPHISFRIHICAFCSPGKCVQISSTVEDGGGAGGAGGCQDHAQQSCGVLSY